MSLQREAKEPTNLPTAHNCNRRSDQSSEGDNAMVQSISTKMRYQRLGTTTSSTSNNNNKVPGAHRVDGPGVFDVTGSSRRTNNEAQRQPPPYRVLPAGRHATRPRHRRANHDNNDDEIPSGSPRHKAAILALTAMGESSIIVGQVPEQVHHHRRRRRHLVDGGNMANNPIPTNNNHNGSNLSQNSAARGHLPEDDEVFLEESSPSSTSGST